MPKLITTSVVRGSHQGESHGGVYLIDIEGNEILKPVDWNTLDIDWAGRGWDRGLRGIAFYDGKIIIAASDMLLFFDQHFNILDSFSNKYLKHCHELSIHGDHLFIASTGYDSILGFNLTTKEFDWGLTIVSQGAVYGCKRFDPRADDGPLLLNKMHINNVFCDQGGMYISGRRTKALLRFDGEKISVMTTLPLGVHNARPYRDGVLFNDTEADIVRPYNICLSIIKQNAISVRAGVMNTQRKCGHDADFFTIKSEKCFCSSPTYIHASLVAKDIIDVHFIKQERPVISTRIKALTPINSALAYDGESPVKLFGGEVEAQDTVVTRRSDEQVITVN